MTNIKATVIQTPERKVDGVAIRATVQRQDVVTGPVSAGVLGNHVLTTNVSVTRTAASSIDKYRAVTQLPNGKIAVPGSISHDVGILGLTTNNVPANGTVEVMLFGEIHDPLWSWSIGSVFASDLGELTQEDTGQYMRRIGVAISSTTLLIDLRETARGQNTILSGHGSPSDDQGNQGDFYLDLDAYVLWGPKGSVWLESKDLIGPQGNDLTVTNHFYVFDVASDHWLVEHNLGYFPSVIVEDSSGDQVFADVKYLNINTLEIRSTFPMAGRVILT